MRDVCCARASAINMKFAYRGDPPGTIIVGVICIMSSCCGRVPMYRRRSNGKTLFPGPKGLAVPGKPSVSDDYSNIYIYIYVYCTMGIYYNIYG